MSINVKNKKLKLVYFLQNTAYDLLKQVLIEEYILSISSKFNSHTLCVIFVTFIFTNLGIFCSVPKYS